MSVAYLTSTDPIARCPGQLVRESSPTVPAESLEELAYRFGRSYDSYLVTDPGREQFWAQGFPGVIAYVRMGKYLHVGGGLLSAAIHKRQLLSQFVEFALARKLIVSFYNIAEDELSLFRNLGFQVTKWGEDALADLAGQTWEGKPFEWVRRQSNYCQRQGLRFTECAADELNAGEWDALAAELRAISSARLADKPQTCEMNFLDGTFKPENLGRKRLFIARSALRIEGFLIANPCLNGTRWALDIFQQRPDAARGTVAFLIHQTLQLLKSEGIQTASLCLIPALRCDQAAPGDSRIIRWGLVIGKYFNIVFDGAGLYHFKSRFRPRFESRYVCAFPKATLGSWWSFVRLSGALDISPKKLVRGTWRRLKKRSRRATLAKPR
jgi:phosphatidylglycerol lysyltransferase